MSLVKNFKDFKKNIVLKNEEFYKSLKDGQNPETLFITCSDSRICPNQMTGTKEGELFVIRNAGNALPVYGTKTDLSISATIEFAILVLGIKKIIVCGHSHCGAVGARTNQDSVPKSFTYLHEYLNLLPQFKSQNIGSNTKINILKQLNNLMSYPYIAEGFKKGELSISGWLYHVEHGDLEVCEYPSEEFKLP